MTSQARSILLHFSIVALLAATYFILPAYHVNNLARIMVFAVYAMGFNLLFGYLGLLSLGHAIFFSAGLYGLGLVIYHFDFSPISGFLTAIVVGVVVSAIIGFLALRTIGVAFMIVTLMFAQAGYLAILLFGKYTRGDEGFVLQVGQRSLGSFDVTDPATRYFSALILLTIVLIFIAWLVRTPYGRCLVAIRENEERARMLGYNTTRYKLIAVIISGTLSAMSGAAFALLFGYVGATFASVQYSIFPLLWVLLGGAGTTIGPIVGTVFMFYLIDYSSGLTSAYMLLVGATLILLTLYAPKGLVGTLRERYFRWLP